MSTEESSSRRYTTDFAEEEEEGEEEEEEEEEGEGESGVEGVTTDAEPVTGDTYYEAPPTCRQKYKAVCGRLPWVSFLGVMLLLIGSIAGHVFRVSSRSKWVDVLSVVSEKFVGFNFFELQFELFPDY